ncbi:MAG TPA: VOC family protein [Candidatus Saccharimonadales bacterium]
MDVRIELIPVPVTDVDRAIEFYTKKVGFNLDHDHKVQPGLRFVQLTPPGSACSIVIGEGITDKQPGTQEIQCVVEDAAALHDELVANGVESTDVESLPWGIFTHYKDPDGNSWAMQQLNPNLQN